MAHYAKAPTIDLTYGVSLRSVLKWKRDRRAKAIENYVQKQIAAKESPKSPEPKPSLWSRIKSLFNG